MILLFPSARSAIAQLAAAAGGPVCAQAIQAVEAEAQALKRGYEGAAVSPDKALKSPLQAFSDWLTSLPRDHREEIAAFAMICNPNRTSDDPFDPHSACELLFAEIEKQRQSKLQVIGLALYLRAIVDHFFVRRQGTRESTPDGVLTAVVLAVQLYLIWRTYQLSREAELRSQRHDRLSVRPALEFYTFGDTESLRIVLNNFGLGPAKVREQIFTVDGQVRRPGDSPGPVDALHDLLRSKGIPQDALQMLRELAPRTWMGAGEEWECVKIALPGYTREQAFDLRDRILIKIVYQSIYGDEEPPFEVESGFMRPRAEFRLARAQ
jgi:hypothetical protein